MVFWLSVIVFIAGIMTYMFFPRSDQYQQDIYQQEGNIVSFVNQHHVAKDLMQQRIMWNFNDNTGIYALPPVDLGSLAPELMSVQDIYTHRDDFTPSLVPDPEDSTYMGSYTSAIVCLTGCEEGTPNCVNGKKLTSCTHPAEQYVITYGYIPNWWTINGNQRQAWRKNQSQAWFRSMLKRTHGGIGCGLLAHRGDGLYSLDNSQKHIGYQTVGEGVNKKQVIPPALTQKLQAIGVNTCDRVGCADPLQDLMLCITPFVNPYEVTPLFWWDSLNKTGTGTDITIRRGTPLIGTLSGSNIDDWDPDNPPVSYTIMGVISSGSGSNQNLFSFNNTTNLHETCTGSTCTLSVQRNGTDLISVSGIPDDREYAFVYSGSASDQILTVYYSYKDATKNKLIFTHQSQLSNIGLPSLSNPKFQDTFKTTPYLKALRIYDISLTARQINHNIKADRKRFGL